MSPDQRQTIIWTNAGYILLPGPSGTNINEILLRFIYLNWRKWIWKYHLQMVVILSRSQCVKGLLHGLNPCWHGGSRWNYGHGDHIWMEILYHVTNNFFSIRQSQCFAFVNNDYHSCLVWQHQSFTSVFLVVYQSSCFVVVSPLLYVKCQSTFHVYEAIKYLYSYLWDKRNKRRGPTWYISNPKALSAITDILVFYNVLIVSGFGCGCGG